MRNNQPQSLSEVLDDTLSQQTNTLRVIQQNAEIILKINHAVNALLPTELKNRCRVANYRQHMLILDVTNASWSTRLTYEKLNLLTTLRQSILPSLSSIDIRINPSLMAKIPQNHTRNQQVLHLTKENKRQISLQTAEYLRYLAEKSPKKLKENLERLAALAGESTNAAKK